MKPHPDTDYIYREKLRALVTKMDTDVDAIIVEGESDKRVLRQLGMETRIFTCGGRNPELFCEDVSRVSRKVVILTDFDTHGKELNREFCQLLEGETDVLNSYRRDFGKLLTSEDRHCVEDIRPLFHSDYDKYVDANLDRLFTPFS